MLKLYFRSLANPLVPYDLYKTFHAIDDGKGKSTADVKLPKLAAALKQLPSENFLVFSYLIHFLVECHNCADENLVFYCALLFLACHFRFSQMDAPNLAMVFAPSLIKPQEEEKKEAGDAALLMVRGYLTIIYLRP